MSQTTQFAQATSAGSVHTRSIIKPHINLIEGLGVEGDAHAGPFVKHRYLARKNSRMPNLRQVHLIAEEMLESLRADGFEIAAGQLGENLSIRGPSLESLPCGSQLAIGASAVIELTGLRTPCLLIDRFEHGLKQKFIADHQAVPYRAGVLGIVRQSGLVRVNDAVAVSLPVWPWTLLPSL